MFKFINKDIKTTSLIYFFIFAPISSVSIVFQKEVNVNGYKKGGKDQESLICIVYIELNISTCASALLFFLIFTIEDHLSQLDDKTRKRRKKINEKSFYSDRDAYHEDRTQWQLSKG